MASCTSVLRNCFSSISRKELTASDVTDAKVQKIACAALSVFAAAAGTLLLGLTIAEALPAGCFAIGFCLLFTAIGSWICGANIKDYDDPKELQQMRDKALEQDYRTLISEHGVGPYVVKYSVPSAEAFIIGKGILSAEELRVKKQLYHEKTL